MASIIFKFICKHITFFILLHLNSANLIAELNGLTTIMHSSTVPEKNEIFHLSTNLRKLNVLCSKLLLKLLFLKHESKIYGPRSGWI